jgi:hypothetical protein
MSDRVELLPPAEAVQEEPGTGTLEQLLAQPVEQRPQAERRERVDGVLVGTLIGFRDPYEPLVIYPGQPGSAALIARASVDLAAEHIGHDVTLMFEDGDPQRPIVTGRIRVPSAWPTPERPVEVEVDADGKRLTLTAKEQLVLRCGKASITLTAAGKVLIQGAYVSNRSSGVMRIKGGSIQLN